MLNDVLIKLYVYINLCVNVMCLPTCSCPALSDNGRFFGVQHLLLQGMVKAQQV